MTEILWFRLLNLKGSCQLLLVLVNRLEGEAYPGTVPLLTDRLDMTSLLTGP